MLERVKLMMKEFFFGFAVLPQIKMLGKAKFKEDSAIMIVALGDMLGIPFVPPIYRLRILPYFIPIIQMWKENLLREMDVVEKLG